MDKKKGLCFRCEERARYLETGHGPRFECAQVGEAKHGCYCYRPVRSVVLAVDDYEKEITKKQHGVERPQFGPWMISARSHFVRISDDLELKIEGYEDGNMIYWVPKKGKGENDA